MMSDYRWKCKKPGLWLKGTWPTKTFSGRICGYVEMGEYGWWAMAWPKHGHSVTGRFYSCRDARSWVDGVNKARKALRGEETRDE